MGLRRRYETPPALVPPAAARAEWSQRDHCHRVELVALRRVGAQWMIPERPSQKPPLGQIGLPHEIPITLARGTAAFVEGPHHQTLSAPAIARREYFGNGSLVFAVIRLDVGARVAL